MLLKRGQRVEHEEHKSRTRGQRGFLFPFVLLYRTCRHVQACAGAKVGPAANLGHARSLPWCFQGSLHVLQNGMCFHLPRAASAREQLRLFVVIRSVARSATDTVSSNIIRTESGTE